MSWMKSTGVGTVAALMLVLAVDASAASARVRCEVEVAKSRLRIKVDGQALLPGTYSATVTNQTAGGTVSTELAKQRTATRAEPDVDLDFDSTAQADDGDSFVTSGFARVGDRVMAVVNQVPGGQAAAASTTCRRK